MKFFEEEEDGVNKILANKEAREGENQVQANTQGLETSNLTFGLGKEIFKGRKKYDL